MGFVAVDLTEVSYLHNRYKFFQFLIIQPIIIFQQIGSGDGCQCAVSFDMSHANLLEF